MRWTPRADRIALWIVGIGTAIILFGVFLPEMRRDGAAIRKQMSARAAETIERVLTHNTRLNPALPDRRAEIAPLLFHEGDSPSTDHRIHLSRDEWADVHGNRLSDREGNQFEIAFDEATHQWRVDVARR